MLLISTLGWGGGVDSEVGVVTSEELIALPSISLRRRDDM
jgi:hypothetical protein